MALSADALVQYRGDWKVRELPAAVDVLYKGAYVTINTAGYVDPAADAAGSVALGVVAEQADNSAGSAGDIRVKVNVPSGLGEILAVVAGMAQTDVNRVVYMTDDELLTTTDPGNTIPFGRITEFQSATRVWVAVANQVSTIQTQ